MANESAAPEVVANRPILSWLREGLGISAEDFEAISPRWVLDDEVVVIADIGHDTTLDQAVAGAVASLEAGAAGVHLHIKDEHGQEVVDPGVWREAVARIRARAPDAVIDRGARGGTLSETVSYLDPELFDLVPVHPLMEPAYSQGVVQAMKAVGITPELAIFDATTVNVAKSSLFDTGTIEGPAVWLLVLSGPVYGQPMPTPQLMVSGYLQLIELIERIDPEGLVLVCASGRATSYLTAFAMLMGQHVRPGRGESPWRWPHRSDPNPVAVETVRDSLALARILGRTPTTTAGLRRRLAGR